MKYKLTKNIHKLPIGTVLYTGDKITLMPEVLVELELAEEIKDDIDIEAIKNKYMPNRGYADMPSLTVDEDIFFSSYRIVKAVIDQLNGDWKPIWNADVNQKYSIWYHRGSNIFSIDYEFDYDTSIIPYCKDRETAQKVIELCEPELKALFEVK